MTPCHAQKYEEALRGMRAYAQEMLQGRAAPEWMDSAIRQHAHYYASEACGEKPMNFSNYTRIQLGLPPASADAGMAAVRRARVMQMNGFGAMAVSEVTGKPCSAGDYEGNWEGYCDCLYTPGGTNMQYCCGKGNVRADGKCGKSSVWSGTGFVNAPWTVLGKAERWAKVNDPNFNILNPATWGPAKQFIEGLQAKGNSGYVDVPAGGGGTGGGGTDTGSGGIEEKKDNTMLIVGGAALLAIGLAVYMKR